MEPSTVVIKSDSGLGQITKWCFKKTIEFGRIMIAVSTKRHAIVTESPVESS